MSVFIGIFYVILQSNFIYIVAEFIHFKKLGCARVITISDNIYILNNRS